MCVFIGDIILLLIAVYLPSFLRNGSIEFNLYYAIFFTGWICLSFIFGKYRFRHGYLRHEITAIFLNSIAVWGLLSLFVISFELFNKSYNLLFRQILLVTCIEFSSRIIYYILNRKKYKKGSFSYFHHLHLKRNQWGLMFLNLLWVFLAFMFLVWLKPATLRIYIPNFYPFLIGLLIWELIINLFTGKHLLAEKERFLEFIIPILRANALTLLILSILVYLFHLFDYSRMIVFGTVILSACFEAAFALYISLHTKVGRNLDESETILSVTSGDEKTARKNDQALRTFIDLPGKESTAKTLIEEQLSLSQHHSPVYNFIAKYINLQGIPRKACSIFNTQTFFNFETLENASCDLLLNLHKVNDINRINDYFSLLNQKTAMGGYVAGCGKTIKGTYDEYCRRFPVPLGYIFYFFHFVFRRVLPKLPIMREINYMFTKGENRTLSKTEILGRLVYSGFKIVAFTEIKGMVWFIAGKVNIPYKGDNPTYGPLISMNRVGKNGKIIKIFKFRTMHPYAEYLQEYIYEQNHLAKGGKLKDDFRIAGWGRVLRKTWIDELPQFINLLRGDIKLVGVRALSQHYFSLYPKSFREYRKQVKPGILPPFYVDMPETMEEIVASEKKYIDAYLKYGILTDIKYGAIILFNIIFRGKRSA